MIALARFPDGMGTGILARVLDETGSPMTSDFFVSQVTGGIQGSPDAAYLDSGRFAVAWRDDDDIYGRIVMLDGSMPHPQVTLPESPEGGTLPVRIDGVPGGGVISLHPT